MAGVPFAGERQGPDSAPSMRATRSLSTWRSRRTSPTSARSVSISRCRSIVVVVEIDRQPNAELEPSVCRVSCGHFLGFLVRFELMINSTVDNDFLNKFDAVTTIRNARRTINLAEVRCVPYHRLIERLKKLPTDSQPSEIVFAIEERDRTNEQNCVLAAAIRELIRIVDCTRGIDRSRWDRSIGRLLRSLPQDLSQSIAVECISHKRKSRRRAGLMSLNIDSDNIEVARHCIECYYSTDDKSILKALLNHPVCLPTVGLRHVLAVFENDEYWQMRVIEAALRTNQSTGIRFSESHPRLFIWAAGRTGSAKLVPEIIRCFETAGNKIDLIGIVAWAYGKFGAYAELRALSSLLKEFEELYEMSSESP